MAMGWVVLSKEDTTSLLLTSSRPFGDRTVGSSASSVLAHPPDMAELHLKSWTSWSRSQLPEQESGGPHPGPAPHITKRLEQIAVKERFGQGLRAPS